MNSHTTPITSTLIKNKLGRLAIRLQQNANPLGVNSNKLEFATLENVVVESVKILSQFYARLAEPGYKPIKTITDTVPDAVTFNNNFIDIGDDLLTIFDEFENLEGVVLGEFNYMVSRLNRLNRKLKSVSSSLGDFILFSNLATKDAIFVSDSFNNLGRVEINSPLLNEEQAEINQVEGIVTLPVDRQAQIKFNITEVPVINSNSNGVSGNNEELNAQPHSILSDILDNNADTWFEYERTTITDDGVALILDFTINLGDASIINSIRINPNNFGTRTQIEIVAIDTSIDGKHFVSIKDDIPIADFTAEEEENIFKLAPSTSKYAGQGVYSFTPRKAKYIHLTFKQSTPYTITTTSNIIKQRYAIGIRDIEIQALPYKSDGEIISTEFVLSDEVRKVVLQSNQNPDPATTSVLACICHYVSPDNGITWHQIRPKISSGKANTSQTVPELLDFNGSKIDTIKTSNPIQSLRYKAVLKRKTDAFTDDSSELAQEIAATTELHTPPTTTPFEISLQQQPVNNSLKLIDPQFGSRGKIDAKYNIALGTGSKLSILLPFKPLIRDYQITSGVLVDKDPESIYVDGELWTRGALSGTNNRYKLNYEEGKIEFGDGTDGNAIAKGSVISMILAEENLFPSRGTDHIATLDYPTSNDQEQMEIYLVAPPVSKTQVLKKAATRHQLEPDVVTNASPYNIKFSNETLFDPAEEKDFIDGSTELINLGDWSIDYANGTLYSHTRTSSTADTSMIYFYRPRTRLANSDWSFQDTSSGISNAIAISDNVFKTFIAPTYTVPTGVKYFNLDYLGIVKGTLSFKTAAGAIPTQLAQEVAFVDGRSELLGVVNVAEQLDAITGISGDTNVSIPLKMRISDDSSFAATFSNQTVFQTEVASIALVVAVGDYFVERTYATSATGRVLVRVNDNIAIPGNITYYYSNPQATLSGYFSVNYRTGEVFSYDLTVANIVAEYEYTDYRARYDIARLVPSRDWSFNTKTKKITIKDREILKNQRTPQSVGQGGTSASKFYQASYNYVASTRANVSELEPFFTPVLKDYALKIITRSRLI